MGDGTRSLLLPIETFESKSLDGTWLSPTEIWKFKGSEVEQYRIKEKLKAKGRTEREMQWGSKVKGLSVQFGCSVVSDSL